MKKRILITGSSGMLGVDLCKELGRGYEVYGLDFVQRTAYSVQRFVKCDITDRESVERVIAKIKPDVVIHAAAWTDVDGCEIDPKRAYKINSDGTKNVALACRKSGAVLIYISTDFVFDGKKKRPYREDDKAAPISVYGDSKLKGETAVRKILKKYLILRTGWLYGRHGKNFVDTIIAKSKTKKELKVVNDQVGCPTYTKDLAEAIGALVEKIANCKLQIANYGTYHVSNSGTVSWYEYAKEIPRLAGSKMKISAISSEELDRPAGRPAMSVLDNGKFGKFTGFKMRPWETALKEYLKG